MNVIGQNQTIRYSSPLFYLLPLISFIHLSKSEYCVIRMPSYKIKLINLIFPLKVYVQQHSFPTILSKFDSKTKVKFANGNY